MEAQLTASNLSFSYGRQRVLENVSFTLPHSTLCCLLGRNGAGKSTLLRCLLGLERRYSGAVLVNGKSQQSYSPPGLAKCLAYIPQAVDCVYEYTVEQFVVMGRAAHLGAFRSPSKADKAIAAQAMQRLHMDHLAHRSVLEISGGERQLATIARALTQQSPILVMDEPTSSLDYGNQIRFMQLARTLARQGYLVFMSCHNPHQARCFADSVMVLEDGKIAASGPAKEIVTPQRIAALYGLDALEHVENIENLENLGDEDAFLE